MDEEQETVNALSKQIINEYAPDVEEFICDLTKDILNSLQDFPPKIRNIVAMNAVLNILLKYSSFTLCHIQEPIRKKYAIEIVEELLEKAALIDSELRLSNENHS